MMIIFPAFFLIFCQSKSLSTKLSISGIPRSLAKPATRIMHATFSFLSKVSSSLSIIGHPRLWPTRTQSSFGLKLGTILRVVASQSPSLGFSESGKSGIKTVEAIPEETSCVPSHPLQQLFPLAPQQWKRKNFISSQQLQLTEDRIEFILLPRACGEACERPGLDLGMARVPDEFAGYADGLRLVVVFQKLLFAPDLEDNLHLPFRLPILGDIRVRTQDMLVGAERGMRALSG